MKSRIVRRLSVLGMSLVAVATLIVTQVPAQAEPSEPYLAVDENFPDPALLQTQGQYWMYATNTGGKNLPVASATDPFGHWTMQDEGMPELGSWARTGYTWAPDVTRLDDGSYLLYYTARDVASERQCVGTARADSPAGPFVPVGDDPLFCPVDQGGAIDASAFVAPDGTRYVTWKNDGNAIGVPTHLYIQKVAADGVTTIGDPIIALTNDPEIEGNLVEAPYLIWHQDRYYLFYAYGSYGDQSYTTGYATARNLGGPWRRSGRALMSTTSMQGAVSGPGGASIVGDLVAFHGVRNNPDFNRPTYLAHLTWRGTSPTVEVG